MATLEQAEALLQRAADAATDGDTRGAVMSLFHAAGMFDTLAAVPETMPELRAGASAS